MFEKLRHNLSIAEIAIMWIVILGIEFLNMSKL